MRVSTRGEVLRLSSGEPCGTEMGKWSMRMDAGLFAGADVLITGAAQAHAERNEPTALVHLATTF
jgi:hypothetical protein